MSHFNDTKHTPAKNLLIFITDQHRADHVGFGGNDIVKTPHLDALAAQSLVFDRAFVANPICTPNRSTLFTGQVPSMHGSRFNGIPLDWSANTFARVLRGAGYDTGYFGKCHLQNMGDNKEIRDRFMANFPIAESRQQDSYPQGWSEWENRARHKRGWVELPKDFYGFDFVRLAIDHGDYCSGHYYQWLIQQGLDPRDLQGKRNAKPYEHAHNNLWRTSVPEELYPTSWISNETAQWIRQRRHDRPFLAVCSYPDPHHPFTPPGKYFDMYDPNEIPLPPTFDDEHQHSARQYKRMVSRRGEIPRFPLNAFAPNAVQFRDMAAKQYGAISMIDDGVGMVMDALKACGQLDNTLVIFTADHGDMFGDHGVMLKGTMHYEGCTRVPLTIKVPGNTPGRTRAFASTLDLASTILDCLNLPGYYGMQGVSLRPIIEGAAITVRDSVYIEEEQFLPFERSQWTTHMRTLICEEGRLTCYRGIDEGELFNHRSDALELHNRFRDISERDLKMFLQEGLIQAMQVHSVPHIKPSYMA